MYHTTAQDLDPALTFAETASFSAAFKTGHIHLGTRLGEREMMRTEFYFCIRAEQLSCELLQGSL